MKIAILNNFLDNIGGAEVTTLHLARGLGADIYTTNINKEAIIKMGFEDILPRIFSIGHVPKQAPFRHQLTFYKFRKLNLSGKYDLFIISGDWAMSGAVNNQPNIWYVHSPLNELWEFKDWIRESVLSAWKRPFYDIFVAFNRILTLRYSKSVNKFVANSTNTKNRLIKYYKILEKNIHVIFPPVDTSKYYNLPNKDYWLSVNRLITHKRVDLQMKSFAKLPEEKLIVVGSYEVGARQFESYKKYVESIKPKNVEIISFVDGERLLKLYSECKGFIATAINEDFGMTPVEAMAAGKPVIAANEGGYAESVIDGETGVLIDDVDENKIVDAIKKINQDLVSDENKYIENSQNRAKNFDVEIFIKRIKDVIDEK